LIDRQKGAFLNGAFTLAIFAEPESFDRLVVRRNPQPVALGDEGLDAEVEGGVLQQKPHFSLIFYYSFILRRKSHEAECFSVLKNQLT
jgi:hypothetical protein